MPPEDALDPRGPRGHFPGSSVYAADLRIRDSIARKSCVWICAARSKDRFAFHGHNQRDGTGGSAGQRRSSSKLRGARDLAVRVLHSGFWGLLKKQRPKQLLESVIWRRKMRPR